MLQLSSIIFAVVTQIGVVACVKFIVWVIFVDTVVAGAVVASIFWCVLSSCVSVIYYTSSNPL